MIHMKIEKLTTIFLCAYIVFFATSLSASFWNEIWSEYPGDPIYNPYTSTAPSSEDYFPCVIFNTDKFDGNGGGFFYKMWHQGPNSLALSHSDDGINWTLDGETDLPYSDSPFVHPSHACVLYDKGGFGGTAKPYQIWYWTENPYSPGAVFPTVVNILYSQSNDGLIWDPPVAITQNTAANSYIVGDPSGNFYYQLYGPGFLLYNPTATSTPGLPYTFPYVMFFDISKDGTFETIGLAYSDTPTGPWTRTGVGASNDPILIPSGNFSEWDANHFFRPSLVKLRDTYHLFYSGSNDTIDPTTTVAYAHGLGHASSLDGINWIKDGEPIFIYSDGVAWRNTRTYTPFVLFENFSQFFSSGIFLKMWFTGGTGLTTGEEQGIGYATLSCCGG